VDAIYVMYDNEAYMNTGIQRSGATPWGAWTTTTPVGRTKPQEKKDITFSWEEEVQLDFSGSGEYRLYWRKQAGTDSDPISVNYFLPQGIAPTFSPSFSLTQGGGYGYNTYLTRDLFSRIIW